MACLVWSLIASIIPNLVFLACAGERIHFARALGHRAGFTEPTGRRLDTVTKRDQTYGTGEYAGEAEVLHRRSAAPERAVVIDDDEASVGVRKVAMLVSSQQASSKSVASRWRIGTKYEV